MYRKGTPSHGGSTGDRLPDIFHRIATAPTTFTPQEELAYHEHEARDVECIGIKVVTHVPRAPRRSGQRTHHRHATTRHSTDDPSSARVSP